MMFNEIVVQKEALCILNEFEIRYQSCQDNYNTADSVEIANTFTSKAIQAGLTIFNCISVEAVMMREERVIQHVIRL